MLIIEQKRPGIFNLTIGSYELAALITSARWVADGAKGELSPEAITQLRQLLNNYDSRIEALRLNHR